MIWGSNRLLSSLPGLPCGGVPAKRNHRAFGIFACPKAGAGWAAPPVLRGFAGTPGAFQPPCPVPFPCRGPSSPPRSILDPCSFVLPISGVSGIRLGRMFFCFLLPAAYCLMCQRMFRAALARRLPLPHAALFTPPAFPYRSVPSGQAMELVHPTFRRRVSHAGCERRHQMNVVKNWILLSDAMIVSLQNHQNLSVIHWRPCLLSERFGPLGETSASQPGGGLFFSLAPM